MNPKTPEIPSLRPNISPDAVLPTEFNLLTWILVAMLLVGGILLAIYLYKRLQKSQELQKKLAPFDNALKALATLSEQQPSLREAALTLSTVVRKVLVEETGDPALFETHEEFSLRADALIAIPPQYREGARQYLQKLARLKYAPETTGQEAQVIIHEGEALLTSLATSLKNQEQERVKYPIN